MWISIDFVVYIYLRNTFTIYLKLLIWTIIKTKMLPILKKLVDARQIRQYKQIRFSTGTTSTFGNKERGEEDAYFRREDAVLTKQLKEKNFAKELEALRIELRAILGLLIEPNIFNLV